jgi:hypothetical protein
MKSSTRNNLQLAFAAVQALEAIFAIAALFGSTPGSLKPQVIWLILTATVGAGLTFTLYSQNRISVSAFPRLAPEDRPRPAAVEQRPRSAWQSYRIHRLVPLTVCSIVASIVIVPMSSDITAAFLVALGPLWIGAVSFACVKLVATHTRSAVVISSLVCGFVGAFVGSAGNAAAELGFIWYCLAGGLTTGYFVTADQQMSIASAITGTVIFVGGTAAIADFVVSHFLKNLSDFVRTGFPFFVLEMNLILICYLLALSFKKPPPVAPLSDESPAETALPPRD